ncbi:hypothetical protein AB0E67_13550 [Streptomyces sp. NPDC032161]|uniref:hypothetical protein n=1 Tax=unclassified Streptomyces TaxID=2593676 RepID=UPI0033E8F0B2
MRQPLDVVIVGAGVVGAARAYYVSRVGRSVAVVDRGPAARSPATRSLAVGHGLVPQLDLAVAAGCGTRVCADGTHAVAVDEWLRTTAPRIWAAGEPGGVAGMELALVKGELTALSVVHEVRGGIRRDAALRAVALSRSRRRLRAFAAPMGPCTDQGRSGAGGSPTTRRSAAAKRSWRGGSATPRAARRRGRPDRRAVHPGRNGPGCGFAAREPAAVHSAPPGVGRCPEGPARRPPACPVKLSELVAEPADPG